jgi:hypothetical protein
MATSSSRIDAIVLVRFAIREADTGYSATLEIWQKFFEVERRHCLIADDQAVGAANVRREIVTAAQQAAANHDRVTAFSELNGKRGRHAQRVPQTGWVWSRGREQTAGKSSAAQRAIPGGLIPGGSGVLR